MYFRSCGYLCARKGEKRGRNKRSAVYRLYADRLESSGRIVSFQTQAESFAYGTGGHETGRGKGFDEKQKDCLWDPQDRFVSGFRFHAAGNAGMPGGSLGTALPDPEPGLFPENVTDIRHGDSSQDFLFFFSEDSRHTAHPQRATHKMAICDSIPDPVYKRQTARPKDGPAAPIGKERTLRTQSRLPTGGFSPLAGSLLFMILLFSS